MANQPTKYRKFVVGAASAALVASAVAPVAFAAGFTDVKDNNSHKEAIDALSAAGVISGYPDGTFQPNKTLSRSDVVKLMGKWLIAEGYEVPADYQTKPRFTDLKTTSNDELLKMAALVYDNGVFVGKPDGTLDPASNITRENMAVVLVRAFDRVHDIDLVSYVNEQDFKKDVTDLGKAKAEARPAINVLDFFDITNPAAPEFNPKNTTTRGQFASFLYKTTQVDFAQIKPLEVVSVKVVNATTLSVTLSDKTTHEVTLDKALVANVATEVTFTIDKNEYTATVTWEVTTPEVKSVSAVNGKTLEIKGSALNKLTTGDITVEGIKVESIKASSDGQTATVALETALNPGTEYQVTVKQGEEIKKYTVKYTFDVETVSITTKTVDEDTKNQKLELAVNGTSIDIDTLVNTNGWDVEFQADKAVFKGASKKTSDSGILDESALNINNSFDVKVVIKKEGVTVESQMVTVSIISNVTPSINDVVLSTTATGKLKSSTITIKDQAVKVDGILSSTGDVINVSGEKVYSSSNKAVASIDSNGVITPLAPGKTTITIKAGKEVFTKEITVVNGVRVATTATPSHDKVALANVAGTKKDVKFTVLDQYGDVVVTPTGLILKTSNNTAENITATTDNGVVTLEVPANAENGNYNVYLHNDDSGKNIGQLTVNLSNENTIYSYKLVGPKTVDVSGTIKFNVETYNQSGGYLETLTSDVTAIGTPNMYQVEAADPKVAKVSATNGVVSVEGLKEGSTDIIFKNRDGQQVAKTHVTVTDKQVKVTGIDWKAKGNTITNQDVEITFADALDITTVNDAQVDDIVNGITLSETRTSKVRITKDDNKLYLDVDDNGKRNGNDVVLGTVNTVQSAGTIAGFNGAAGHTQAIATTALGNKGTLTFTFTDRDSNVVSSSTLNVDVKNK